MPRYFFHLQNGIDSRDEEGLELPDLDAARAQAALATSTMLNDEPGAFWRTQPWHIKVEDQDGRVLCGVEVFAMSDERLARS